MDTYNMFVFPYTFQTRKRNMAVVVNMSIMILMELLGQVLLVSHLAHYHLIIQTVPAITIITSMVLD